MRYPDLINTFCINHVQRLRDSFHRWTGKSLLPDLKPDDDPVLALFDAPFVLVSHGPEPTPVFNFGNRKALELFEISWEQFIKLPSKNSAGQENQEDRAELMARVARAGYALNCTGTRISTSGKRFYIEGATVWNVIDENNLYHGQAAMFDTWAYL